MKANIVFFAIILTTSSLYLLHKLVIGSLSHATDLRDSMPNIQTSKVSKRNSVRSERRSNPSDESPVVNSTNLFSHPIESVALNENPLNDVAVEQTTNLELPVEVLAEDQISPNSIFNEQKYSNEEIKGMFESSLRKLGTFSSVAKIEDIDCTQERCRMTLFERLPEDAQVELYSYYLDHPQFGKYIHSDRSKDDPIKIVYTFSDEIASFDAD